MIDPPTERDSASSQQSRTLRRVDPGVRHQQSHQSQRASQVAPRGEDSTWMNPAFLWWTFCQWWKVAIPVGLLLAGLAAAGVVLTYQPNYKASALVMVEDSAPYIAFSGSGPSGNDRKYVETQVELLRSPMVLGPVLGRREIGKLEEFKQSPDKLQLLQKKLRISRIGRSELYRVSYTSKSPKAAAEVANAVVAEYLEIQSSEDYSRTQRVIDILEEERRQRSLDVERLRQKVVRIGKDVTGRDPFAENSIIDLERANNPATTLFQEIAQLDMQQSLAKAEIAATKEMAFTLANQDEKSGLLNLEVASAVSNHPEVIETENLLALLHAEMAKVVIDKKRGKTDAKWLRLEKQALQYEAILVETKAELKEKILAVRLEQHDLAQRESLGALQRKFDRLHTMRALLTEKFEASIAELRKNGGKSIELEFARAELEREEKVFELIASRKLAMQTELRAPTRVRSRLPASEPKRPIAPLPMKMLTLACSAAMVAPFGLALLREISVQRIGNAEQLSRDTPLRILGEVSRFPIKQVAIRVGARVSGKLRRQMFLYNESIDSLRTSLMLASGKQNQQLLVVTSAAAGEAKTSLATSLAMSIANATKTPTLIIDADMRSPDVATILAVENSPGLAELLVETAELDQVIKRVGDTQTYVLPAGRLQGNPHHLLQNSQLKLALEQLRKKFPTIIIDTPPVFGGSESLVFAEKADGVIVSTLSDVSRTKQVNLAVKKLELAGANVLGAVLNGRSASSYAHSYGYGHYSSRNEIFES